MASSDDRSADELRRFVEHFALLLTEAGLPRMPARAFACILADDSGQLTAAQLAERLEVSPAAISGAVRYLTQVGMLVRGREPGARVDHFRLHDDVWAGMYTSRLIALRRWEDALAEGVDLLGTDSPAGRRLEESRDFFAFLQEEVEGIVERWQARRATRAGKKRRAG
jgi:DNA-binding transcriptional regulator GbsR (MarR family)